MSEPLRLNKHLAQTGIATRREADQLIEAGKIWVNGKKAILGMKVTPDDTIEVRHGKNTKPRERIYIAYNKPKGIISHSPQGEEKDIISSLPKELQKLELFPVGRLDKDSYGLIIVTNDGRITDRLLNPDHEHTKEYKVTTKLPLRDSFKKHMEAGVDIEGYVTKPTAVKLFGEKSFSITLSEGKKHQIRRMVVAMHNEVTDLKRTRILNIKLGKLAIGEARMIDGKEREEFLTSLGL